MRRTRVPWTVGLLLLTASCSSAQLEAIIPYFDDTLALDGEFCTTDPADIVHTTKILFLIDCSDSMRWNDPDGDRAAAILDVATSYAGEEAVQFGIIRFGSEVVVETETFTNDLLTIEAALGPISDPLNPDQYLGGTDYISVLDEALDFVIADRIGNAQDEDANYVVVFITDGAPQAADSDPNVTVATILELADTMHALGATLHTMMLSAGLQGVPPEFLTILEDMAREGGGEYRQLAGPETIGAALDDLLDLSAVLRLFDLHEFMVENLNTVTTIRDGEVGIFADSDGDGIPDFREEEIGTSPTSADTDGDGLSDLVEIRIGYDPIAHEVFDLGPADLLDDDGDGLSGYEERLLDTDPLSFDTDRDGIPDGIEVRYDTNPRVEDDLGDYDNDYVPNIDEIRAHTNPRLDENGSRAELGYRYGVESLGRDAGRYCYHFSVENIRLRTTLATETMDEGHNTVVATVVDVPEDNPELLGNCSFGHTELIYLEPSYREPAALVLELGREDFE